MAVSGSWGGSEQGGVSRRCHPWRHRTVPVDVSHLQSSEGPPVIPAPPGFELPAVPVPLPESGHEHRSRRRPIPR
eukprot:3629076-Pyramimonas_sp.AAC.1